MLHRKRPALVLLLAFALIAPVYVESTQATDCNPTSTVVGSSTRVTFTNSNICDWEIPSGVTSIDLLVVAGGGGGDLGTIVASNQARINWTVTG